LFLNTVGFSLLDDVTVRAREDCWCLLSRAQTTFPAKNCFWCTHFEKKPQKNFDKLWHFTTIAAEWLYENELRYTYSYWGYLAAEVRTDEFFYEHNNSESNIAMCIFLAGNVVCARESKHQQSSRARTVTSSISSKEKPTVFKNNVSWWSQ
jgi:hypothetical protein